MGMVYYFVGVDVGFGLSLGVGLGRVLNESLIIFILKVFVEESI